MFIGDVAAHRMALVPTNAAFPLLEVERVNGKVPVDQVMTLGAKVETLLTHGRAGDHEGPKRVPHEMTNAPEARPTRDRCGLEAAGWLVQNLDELDFSAARGISVRQVRQSGTSNLNRARVPGRVSEGLPYVLLYFRCLETPCVFSAGPQTERASNAAHQEQTAALAETSCNRRVKTYDGRSF